MKKQHEDVAAGVAGRCIGDTLSVEVIPNDVDGRQGEYDLKLIYEERTIAVEVKRVVDPLHQEAGNKSSALGYTRQQNLTYSWWASLTPTKRWNRALERMPTLLLELEQHGFCPDNAQQLRRHDLQLLFHLNDLGIKSLICLTPTEKHPPGYYMLQDAWGGMVPEMDDAVTSACKLIASRKMDKLRNQLAKAEADERHAFLIYGSEFLEAIPFSEPGALPSAPPDLPDGVDGVWFSTLKFGSAAVAWVAARGWIRAASMKWPESESSQTQ